MLYNLLTFASVMKSIGGVVLAIVILLAMVTIHEFGHYVAGKILGFKINEFSVGFGPALFKKRSKRSGELFALRVIPLGGYCAFDGEDEMEEEGGNSKEADKNDPFEELTPISAKLENEEGMVESKQEMPLEKEEEYPEPKGERFNNQPPWKRIIVLLAGATMNYLLALVLLLIMVGVYGQPMCIAMPMGYDGEMQVPHAEWSVETLAPRDILLEINGVEISMVTDCIDGLKGLREGDEATAKVLRRTGDAWQEKEVKLVLLKDASFTNMSEVKLLQEVIGLEIYTTTLRRGGWHTIGGALEYSAEMGTAIIRTLGELLTGRLGMEAVGGPVTTITTTAKVAANSLFSFLYIASFIGVNLAVFNLLPIPALDGCKVIFCIIEWIRKKPVNRKVEAIIHFIGIVFLFGFAILVDLLQIF